MALFDMTFAEKSEVENWLRAVRDKLEHNTREKSLVYDFDFCQGRPVDSPKRFEWTFVEDKVNWMDRDPSTRPSRDTTFGMVETSETEFLEDIPEFEILL